MTSPLPKLKRSDRAILPLVLKKRWYDLIASGEKVEEYREYKRFWSVRLLNWSDEAKRKHLFPIVAFSLGYNPATMFFKVPLAMPLVSEKADHPEWGETTDPHYVIELRHQVELEDWQ